MKVILISGKARSGKDTTASIIAQRLKSDGDDVRVLHYADLLKYICKEHFGWDGEKDEHGRTLLQVVGTDIFRSEDPTFWTDYIVKLIRCVYQGFDYVIIPDCRFENEIADIENAGFDTLHIRIARPNGGQELTEGQMSHPSETSLDKTPPDYWVENSGTLEELAENINIWIEEVLYDKGQEHR